MRRPGGRSADLVVGVDGACFANVLWAAPTATVLAVVPAKTNYVPFRRQEWQDGRAELAK